MDTYVCNKCGLEKPANEYGKFTKANGKTYRRGNCKQCGYDMQVEYMKRRRTERPMSLLQSSIKESCRQLKLNFDIVWPYYQSHNGLCEICNQPPSKGKRLVLDHNHDTGEFRGLLCNECNRALGYFRDCPNAMARAIDYVARTILV